MGWGGFTSLDVNRCPLTARMVAWVDNGWPLSVHLLNPKQRLEAITYKPLLLRGIQEKTRHARRSITPTHGFGARPGNDHHTEHPPSAIAPLCGAGAHSNRMGFRLR
jgi:hypothetical protein